MITTRMTDLRAKGTWYVYTRWWTRLWLFAKRTLEAHDPHATPPQTAEEWHLLASAYKTHMQALPIGDTDRATPDGHKKFQAAASALIGFLAFPDDKREAASAAQLMHVSRRTAAARDAADEKKAPLATFNLAAVFTYLLTCCSLQEASLSELRQRAVVLIAIDRAARRGTVRGLGRSEHTLGFDGTASMQLRPVGEKGTADSLSTEVSLIAGFPFDPRICAVATTREWLTRSAPLLGYPAGTLTVPEAGVPMFCAVYARDDEADAARLSSPVEPYATPAAALGDDRVGNESKHLLHDAANYWARRAESAAHEPTAARFAKSAALLRDSTSHDVRRAVVSFLDTLKLASIDEIVRLGGWKSAATFRQYYRGIVAPQPVAHPETPCLPSTYEAACAQSERPPLRWVLRSLNFHT